MIDLFMDLACIVAAIFVFVIVFRMVKIMKMIENSRYRNCDITLNDDQFREVMDFLYYIDRKNEK